MIYINSKGEKMIISEMQDNHLINAYIKIKREIHNMQALHPKQQVFVKTHLHRKQELSRLLRKEIDSRKLL